MLYAEYLKTEHWRKMRKRALWHDNYRCRACGTATSILGKALHTHHINYDRMGHERLEDLCILCSSCHQVEHGVGEVIHAL